MVQALEIAALIVVGYLTYRVVVHYLVIQNQHKPRSRPRTEDPPQPELPKSEPQTGGDPKTTEPPPPPPPPPPRRYPNQSCENDELDRLEAEKNKLCGNGYAVSCKGDLTKPKFKKIPCSAIKLSIQQRQACLRARKLVQEKCFGGKPDAGHKNAIDEVQNGIDSCEALKSINCAKGHPQAGF